MDRGEQLRSVQDECFELFKKKNHDYGDAFADFGTIGVLIRMNDKIRRLINLSEKGISYVNDESLRDTLVDLNNYTSMAIMLMDEKKTNNQK